MNDLNQNTFSIKSNEFKDTTAESTLTLPITVELKYPIQFGKKNKARTQVIFHTEPTVGSMKHLPVNQEAMQYGHWLPIISAMSDITQRELDLMHISDFAKCITIITPFMNGSEDTEMPNE